MKLHRADPADDNGDELPWVPWEPIGRYWFKCARQQYQRAEAWRHAFWALFWFVLVLLAANLAGTLLMLWC